MDEEKILKLFRVAMQSFKKENASKLVNIVNELEKLTYNEAMQLLSNVEFVVKNSKISLS